MIIRRLRYSAPVYVSAFLLLVGISLAAHATQPMTESQTKAFVFETIGAAAVVTFGSFWLLLNTLVNRVERSLSAHVDRIEQALDDALAGMKAHDENPRAHYEASEHNHKPMNEQMNSIETKLDNLLMEHRIIRGAEDEVCKFVRQMATHRDPKDSPKPKREGDSGDDYTPLRGKG